MVIVSLGDAPPRPQLAAPEPVVTAPAVVKTKAKSRHASVGARRKKGSEAVEKVNQVVVGTPVKLLPLETQVVPQADMAGDVRGILMELSKAFQENDEPRAIQVLSRLLQNPQGLESLKSLPGFDEKTARYIQQALSVTPHTPSKDVEGMAVEEPQIVFPPEEQRRMVAEDWKQIQQRSRALKASKREEVRRKEVKVETKALMTFWKSSKGAAVEKEVEKQEEARPAETNAMDFSELLLMNAGIIGANMSFVKILLSLFEQLLAPTVNGQPGEAETMADVAALRFFREAKGSGQLAEFKTSMLASARALLPGTWDSAHETAWAAVWDCITVQLSKAMPLPERYRALVQGFVRGLSKEQRTQLGVKTFDRLFRETPEVSHYFKQSKMRLAFIIGKALDFASRLFDEPQIMVDEMTALGLKHIMFQAQSQFFRPWVVALVTEIQQISKDEEVVQAMNYALCVIGSLIGQALEAGTTPVLQAVVNDDVKALKRALATTPRAERVSALIGRP